MAQYSDPYEEWKAQGRPGSFKDWQAGQQPEAQPPPPPAAPAAPGQAPAAPAGAPAGTTTPAQLRANAKSGQWSEDFDRFSDAQLQAWLNTGLYDPSTGKFRSENDPNGPAIYDKPAECPAGTSFHGNRCVPYGELPEWSSERQQYDAERGIGGGGGGAPSGGPSGPPVDPLQQQLLNLYQERGGMFSGQQAGGFGDKLAGGGIFWGEGGQGATPALAAAALNAFTPQAPSQTGAGQPYGGSGGWQVGTPSGAPPLANWEQGTPSGAQPLSTFAAGASAANNMASMTQQPQGQVSQTGQPGQPLANALMSKYKDPNRWWAGEQA